MSLYRNVHVSMWGDAKFRALSDDGKMLWLYLLTGPETTSAPGCIAIGRVSLAEALDWEAGRLDRAFEEVQKQGMARADWRARFIWLPNATKYIVPVGWKHVQGWIPYLQILPECELRDRAIGALWRYVQTRSEDAQRVMIDALGKPYLDRCAGLLDTLSDTVSDTLSDTYDAVSDPPYPIQDQDQDQDQEIPPLTPPASQGGDGDEGASPRKSTGQRKRKSRQLSDAALAVQSEIRERLGVEYPPATFDALEARLQAKELSPEDALVLTRWACADPFWGAEVKASPSTIFRPKHYAELLAKAKAAPAKAPVQHLTPPRRDIDIEEHERVMRKWEGYE